MQCICKPYAIYALCEWKYARPMQCICITYVLVGICRHIIITAYAAWDICRKYAKICSQMMVRIVRWLSLFQVICSHMHGLRRHLHSIRRSMKCICITYAWHMRICSHMHCISRYMHTYADMEGTCKAYARHMQAYASICLYKQTYARHLQVYALHMWVYHHYICTYMHVYAKICSQYNTEHMQNIKCRTYASSTQEYARICIL